VRYLPFLLLGGCTQIPGTTTPAWVWYAAGGVVFVIYTWVVLSHPKKCSPPRDHITRKEYAEHGARIRSAHGLVGNLEEHHRALERRVELIAQGMPTSDAMIRSLQKVHKRADLAVDLSQEAARVGVDNRAVLIALKRIIESVLEESHDHADAE